MRPADSFQIMPATETSEATPLLAVKNLKKHFPVKSSGLLKKTTDRVHAVDGVSFSVRKGSTLGIVGESGCGKSTTARLVAKLIEPDAGELIFDGQGVGDFRGLQLKEFRKRLQMVFQDSFASLNPRLTMQESIAYGARVHGMPKAAAIEKARSLLDKVGLNPAQFADRYPHELSGGQRQRVNIARALAFDPQLLILDESVAALDKSVQAQVLNLLQTLKHELGLTYLFISHDLHVVHYMADEVVVMYLGEIVESGPVTEIFQNPAHPYTQALLRSVPSMDPDRRTQHPPLSGDPPNPVNPPAGCRFAERCPNAMRQCKVLAPLFTDLSAKSGHRVACHLYGEGHE